MNVWRLLAIIKYRKWMILGAVAVTLIVIAIAAPKPKVVYEASVYMSPTQQVMQGGVTVLTNNQAASFRSVDRNVILSNLILLVQGGEVYDKALDFLAKDEAVQRKLVEGAMGSGLPLYRRLIRIQPTEGQNLTFQHWNKDILEVAPVVNASIGEKGTTTDIIRITVRMPNGDEAPFVANAVGFAFAQAFQAKSREDTRQYAKFLESSKNEARERLYKLQTALAAYKQGHSVAAADAQTASAVAETASLGSARDAAQAAASEAQAQMRDIEDQLRVQPAVTTTSLPAEMNPQVSKLRDELAQAEAELNLISQRYKPAHETYQLAESKVSMLRSRLAKEGVAYSVSSVNDIRQTLLHKRAEAQTALASARARLAAVSASYGRAQGRVSQLTIAQPGLAELMVERAQAESAYSMLSQKRSEAQIAEKEFTRTGSIVPYDWSRAAVGPVIQGPGRKQLLVYGLVLSLILAIVAVVWLDSIDQRMRNADDVERLLELPVIGLTPKLTGQGGQLPKLTHLYPLSASAESYKILRTNLLFEMRDKPFKTLMVATGRPGQGATTTVCNLAIALAQIGKKIILIDADMRRPSLHKFFELKNDIGLSTILSGQSPVTEAFQKTDVENLVVVTAGPQPMNPSELLGSERMRRLVAQLEEHCDLVLFDSPSTVVFSDGPMLASWIDAVIMVVSANMVPRGTETHTRDLLRRAKANILGVVVNRMAADNIDSCYFYDHYYADSALKPGVAPSLGAGETGDGRKARGGMKAISEHAEPPKPEQEEVDNPFPD